MMSESTESLPFSEETAGTGIGGGNGAATPEGVASVESTDPQVAGSSEHDPEGGDYYDRVREGGEFAEEQIKHHIRKFGKANSERDAIKEQMESIRPLQQIADQYQGTQNVLGRLQILETILADPAISAAVTKWNGVGAFSLGEQSGETDEYVDPVEAELRAENKELTQRLSRLEGNVFRQDSTLAQNQLRDRFQAALKEFPFNEPELAKIHEKAESTINQWSQTTEGVQALQNLDEKSVRTLIRGTLEPDEWIDIVRRMDSTRHEERRRLATDAPATTATSKAQSTAKTTADALREAMKNERMDPSRGLVP